jgi:C4-dicarboxylate-specific signal transduction histidine kinase
MRLSLKITLLMLLVGFIPLAIMGVISFTKVEASVKLTSDSALSRLAAELGKEIVREVNEGYRNILLLAVNPIIKSPNSSQEAIQKELAKTHRFHEIFKDITLIDPQGQVVTSVLYSFRGTWKTTKWFKSALAGKTVYSNVHVVLYPYDVVMTVATPVRDDDENLIGVLVGQIELEQIWQITRESALGKNSEILVLDENGVIISAPDSNQILEAVQPAILMDAAIKMQTGITQFEQNEITKVANYVPVGEIPPYPNLNWMVVIIMPETEIYSPVFRTRNSLLIASISSFVIIIVFTFLMSRPVSKRIRKLLDATRILGQGDLSKKVEDLGRDELGELGRTFNWASEQLAVSRQKSIQAEKALQTAHDNLEIRVQQRTAEYLQAKETAEKTSVELETQNKKLKQAHEEIVQREKKLKDAQSQLVLSEKMASLGVLIAGIAHEINTPVGAIANVSSDLRTKVKTIMDHLMNIHDLSPEELHLLGSLTEQFTNGEFVPESGLQWKKSREIRKWLAESGVENDKGVVTILSKYNLLDKERLAPYKGLLKKQWAVNLMDSVGTVDVGMQICDSSIKKISEIVKALKYYAYTDMDKTSLVDINENIQNALLLMHNKLKYGLDVEKELQSLPPIDCTSEMSQVWTNLISNAHDAVMESMASNTLDKKGKIWIKSSRDDDWVRVQISDNGVGISKEDTGKMFDPFYTTKGIGKGTGLGLSIVSGIIKKHKGQISVDSVPGKTTFTVSLPINNGNGAAING